MEIGFPLGKFRRTHTVARRDGLYVDVNALDHQVALRAITIRTLAKKAGIPEETLSRMRKGRRIRESTLRRLVEALRQIPILEGASLVVAAPATRDTSVAPKESPAKTKEVRRASGRTSPRA